MTYRNRQLLDLCHAAPCCLQLGHEGCGRDKSVPCHSDMIRHGRGANHKSHDCFAVPGCPVCHEYFKRSVLGREGYLEAWTAAMERYILWLWVSQSIRVVTKRDIQKEPSMEAPLCRLCEKRYWSREGCDFGKNTNADEGKAPKGGERRPGRSGDCSSSRLIAQAGGTPVENTSREGRDVLKAEAARPDATSTLPTGNARPAPANPGKTAGKKGTAAKPAPGKRKTAPKANRKRVKKP